MNAIPPRKNSAPTTSPAATRLSAKPVSEIAFGVSRDSISRLRISSCVVGPLAGAARAPRVRARARSLGLVAVAAMSAGAATRSAVARPNAHASGRARASRRLRQQRGRAGGERAEERVGEEVVGRSRRPRR